MGSDRDIYSIWVIIKARRKAKLLAMHRDECDMQLRAKGDTAEKALSSQGKSSVKNCTT